MKILKNLVIIIFIVYILYILVEKRIKKRKKNIILQIGSDLSDKGGIATVMNEIISSRLGKKYNIKQISTYINGHAYKLFFIAIIKIFMLNFIYNIEIAHIHMASKGSFYRKSIIIRICKLFNIKVVLHAHGSEFEKFYDSSKHKKYIKRTLNKVDKLIVLSNSWKEFYSKLVDNTKIQVVYNGVKIYDNIEKNNNEIKQGLFLGRMGKRKGIYDLIDAVELLRNENYNFKIVLAGDGEIDNVKKIIKTKGLQKYFEIVGWIDGKQKDKIFNKSDFLVLPSYNEGLPMSILEAMSRKVLVISTNAGGIPEIINNGNNGILIESGNIYELKSAIKNAIIPNDNIENIKNKALETIKENFNIEDMINEIEKIYISLIYKNIKVCLTSSSGGHFMQLKQLFDITKKYNTFIVTEKNVISLQLKSKYKVKYLVQQERKNIDFIFEFFINILKSIWIVITQKPDVVISTGAGATYPICKLVKMTGGKVIFIESFAKIKSPTVTGKKVYKFADEFYVQWPEMLKYYPKAKYRGGIY